MCSGFLLFLVVVNLFSLLVLYLRVKRVKSAIERLSFDDVAFLKLFYPEVAGMLAELIEAREKGAISKEEYEKGLELLKGEAVSKEVIRFGLLLAAADICGAFLVLKTCYGG